MVYVEDACRGVAVKDIEDQKKKLVNNGAIIANSKQVCIREFNERALNLF